MLILGIDPGIADTGYGFIKEEKGKTEVLAYGSIKTKAGQDLPTRLKTLAESLEKLIEKHQPTVAVVEQLF